MWRSKPIDLHSVIYIHGGFECWLHKVKNRAKILSMNKHREESPYWFIYCVKWILKGLNNFLDDFFNFSNIKINSSIMIVHVLYIWYVLLHPFPPSKQHAYAVLNGFCFGSFNFSACLSRCICENETTIEWRNDPSTELRREYANERC